jgi:dihydropteroate synthase
LPFDQAIDHAERMIGAGADVIEVGGESTRPGATPVAIGDEMARILPVIEEIAQRWPSVSIAVDTVKSEVASAAIAAGATVVNDVSALRIDPHIADVCSAAGCTLVLMHSRGEVGNMASYQNAGYEDVMGEIIHELAPAAAPAVARGIARERIVLDPGLGFSKRPEHSVQALAHLARLVDLGFQVMVGASRKRFIGELTGVTKPAERDAGTIGANVVALTLGATWFRVHDVLDNRHALDAAAAILGASA